MFKLSQDLKSSKLLLLSSPGGSRGSLSLDGVWKFLYIGPDGSALGAAFWFRICASAWRRWSVNRRNIGPAGAGCILPTVVVLNYAHLHFSSFCCRWSYTLPRTNVNFIYDCVLYLSTSSQKRTYQRNFKTLQIELLRERGALFFWWLFKLTSKPHWRVYSCAIRSSIWSGSSWNESWKI